MGSQYIDLQFWVQSCTKRIYTLWKENRRERVWEGEIEEKEEKNGKERMTQRENKFEKSYFYEETERINSVSAISLVSTLSQSFLNPSFSNFYLWLLCYTFTSFFLSCLFILVRIGFFLHGTKKKKKTSTWHRIVNIVQIEWKLGWTGKVKSTGIYLRGRK